MSKKIILFILLIGIVVLFFAVLAISRTRDTSEKNILLQPSQQPADLSLEEDQRATEAEIDTSDWKTWSSNDYNPNCDADPYCHPLEYYIGVIFRYPPYLTVGGYQDMGGGLLLYSNFPTYHNQVLYVDCGTRTKNELDEWFGLPKPTNQYTLIEKRNVSFGNYQGIQALLEINEDASKIRRIELDKHIDIRFYMEKDNKACWIQANLNVEREILEKMISSFEAIS